MSSRQGFIHQVHIADGFADDCEEIIHRCSKIEGLTYHTFTEIWKDMNMATMYNGRTSGAEIAELSEEVLYIAKHYMVADTSNYEESVAGLFLVYALLNLQPFPKFASVRLTPEDVMAINRIEVVGRRERRLDVLYALGAVLVKGAHYHADHRERGMDASLRKYLDGYTSIDRMGVRPKGVFYRQNEELDVIRELNNVSRRYDESKAAIAAVSGRVDRNLNYCDPNLSTDLSNSLKKIINGIISDDDGDNDGDEESDQPDHYNSVQAIKSRAMKGCVNPMKHLTGIQERKNRSPKKMVNKSPISNTKADSPKQATSSPRKRKTTPKKPGKKKPKRTQRNSFSSVSDTDDEFVDLTDLQKENKKIVDLSEFHKDLEMAEQEEEDREIIVNIEIPKNPANEAVNEQEINIEIDSLPIFIRTETEQDEMIEIEVIDNYKDKNKKQGRKKQNLKSKLLSMPDVSVKRIKHIAESDVNYSRNKSSPKTEMAEISKISATQKDDHVFKKPNDLPALRTRSRRELKKPILKSKFKRMGILPVANFEDSK